MQDVHIRRDVAAIAPPISFGALHLSQRFVDFTPIRNVVSIREHIPPIRGIVSIIGQSTSHWGHIVFQGIPIRMRIRMHVPVGMLRSTVCCRRLPSGTLYR